MLENERQLMNNLFFIIASLIIIFYILFSIRKNKLDIANSFIWIVFCVIILVLSIWPTSLDWLATLLGIAYPPTLFLTIAIAILSIMIFVQSKKIEDLRKKTIDLCQELSIVKNNQKNAQNKSRKTKSNPSK